MKPKNLLIGSPMERVEDLRLLRGRGQFVADINFEGQLHAVIARSAIWWIHGPAGLSVARSRARARSRDASISGSPK